jgi:hypothetical protein
MRTRKTHNTGGRKKASADDGVVGDTPFSGFNQRESRSIDRSIDRPLISVDVSMALIEDASGEAPLCRRRHVTEQPIKPPASTTIPHPGPQTEHTPKPKMLRRAALATPRLTRAAVHAAVPKHAAPALATRFGPQPRRWLMVQEPGTRERPAYDKCVWWYGVLIDSGL